MAGPSALARGRIQILEGESLTVRGPPGSSCRYQGPSKVAEQSPGQPSSSSRKTPRSGPPVLPQQSSKAGPGPREGARTPARWRRGSWGCVVLWDGEEDTGESLKQGQEATVLRWWALHESLLVGGAVELEEKLVIFPLLLQLPLQLAPVADEVEGEAEPQQAHDQQPHVHLGRQG